MATDSKYIALIFVVFLHTETAADVKFQDGVSLENVKLQNGASLENVYTMMETVIRQNEAVLKANDELRMRNAELELRVENLEKELHDVDKVGEKELRGADKVVALKDERHVDVKKNVPGKRFVLADFSSVGTTAFSAVVSPADLSNISPGQAIIFDQTITNIANTYDNTTGVFTSPIQGVYVFNFAVMINAGDNEYVELVVDGSHVMWNYGHAQGSLHYISASRTVTLALNQGQKVWVRVYQSSHHGTGRIHGNGYTTFSGWLIAITE